MFFASYENTMRNARPKFVEPEPVRTIEQIREEKRIEAERIRRARAAAWAAKLEEARLAAEREARALKDAAIIAAAFHEPQIKGKQPVREIIEQVAAFYGMPYEVILSHRRDRKAVEARYAAIKAARETRPDLSVTVLGKLFNRDHTTILHALGRLSS